MKALYKAALLLATHLSSAFAVMVGDEVCITGYIMDNYCIFDNAGFLLDNRNVITLQNPEEHSFHCLLDVDLCYESGFQVLGDKNPDTDRHCLGFRLDDTDAVLAAGRALGKCDTCSGGMDMDPEYGYRATVKGTVKEMGDGSDGVNGPPMLTNVQMLDQSVGCDDNPTIPPLCVRSVDMTTSPTNEPTNQPAPSAPTISALTTAFPTDEPINQSITSAPTISAPTTGFPTDEPTNQPARSAPTISSPTTAFPTDEPINQSITSAPTSSAPTTAAPTAALLSLCLLSLLL